MKKWVVILLGIIFFYDPFIGRAGQTPKSVLIEIQHAIDSHNFALFEQCVDVNSLLTQSIEYFFYTLSAVKDTSNLPPLLFFLASSIQSPKYAIQLSSFFVNELNLFIQYGISSGLFAGNECTFEPTGLLSRFISKISLGRKEVLFSESEKTLTKTYQQHEGDIVVSIQIRDYGNGCYYPVLLGMSHCNNRWKVTAIKNLPELCKKFEQEYIYN